MGVGLSVLASVVGFVAAGNHGAAALPVTFAALPLPGDQLDGEGLAVVQLGGIAYVGGLFTTVRDQAGAPVATRANLAAFDLTTGRLVSTFRADTNGPVRALATDGVRIYAGGSFTTVNGAARSRLAALDPITGAVDPAFHPSANSNVYGIATYQDRLVVGGSFSTIAGAPRSRFAVVATADGAVLPIAPSFDATLAAVGVTSDGSRFVVGGAFTTVNGIAQHWGALLDATGALTSAQLDHLNGPLSAIRVAAGNDTFVASMTGGGNSGNRYRLADGRRQWAQYCDGDGQAIEEYSGTVYSGFHEGCGGDTTIRLTANDSATGLRDPAFRPAFDRFWGSRSFAAGPLAFAVAGDFTSISGVRVQGIAIFPSTGAPPPPTTTSTSTTPPTTVPPTTTTTTIVSPPTTTTTTAPAPPTSGFPIALRTAWRYRDAAGTPPAGWNTTTFDDAGWASGPGQLGYGDGDEATVLSYGPNATSKTITSYFRRVFTLGALPTGLRLQLVADDGAVVYVNGVEVVRDNMPAGLIGPTTLAASNRSGVNESNPRAFTIPASALRVGANVIAVEVHQDAGNTSDLSFDLAVSTA